MKLLAPLATLAICSLLATACHDKTSASSADGSVDRVPTASASAPASSVLPALGHPPDLSEPRLTSVSARPSSIVDVVNGRAPDDEHLAGTVYVASVLENDHQRGEATLFEWDVATASVLDPHGHLLYLESDKEDLGKTTSVRIAAGGDQLFTAVTLEPGGRTSIQKATNVGHPRGTSFVRDDLRMRNVSLETDGRWLAVAYELPPNTTDAAGRPRSGILLYDAFTMQHLATFAFSQSHENGVRYDTLEMLGGKLYAAEAGETTLHVVELAMPTLRKEHEASIKLPKGSSFVQLSQWNGRLIALTHEMVIELTTSLAVGDKRPLAASEVALGPAGQLLTPVGLERGGHRGDVVPDVHASASCTPWWMRSTPLLACTVGGEGIRIARLAPP